MKTVVISILGTKLDERGAGHKRWNAWRPTIALCQQDDLHIDKLVILYQSQHQYLLDKTKRDIEEVSPDTEVSECLLDLSDPWDFELVYGELFDFAKHYQFDLENESYLIHITTGTHVAQICLYLLTEANYLPGKLVQTSPNFGQKDPTGTYQIIDLDLSKYDLIGSRFKQDQDDGRNYLKQGIETRNQHFNEMIAQIEKVSVKSKEPILLVGPTGAGKSQLAKRIFDLKKHRGHVFGQLVIVNCATLQGENAMSALFGHAKGAFIGATTTRKGLLREANGGVLFLDEIGELGLKEQAMLLRAIEEKKFLPVGSDKERTSQFELIVSTNLNLTELVKQRRFRKDLLSRIHVWTYQLPSLKERMEDFEPNLDFELKQYSKAHNMLVRFNKDARLKYLHFATSPSSLWINNFRDLNASLSRMATLSEGGRINETIVNDEIERLKKLWQVSIQDSHSPIDLAKIILGSEKAETFDLYDLIQLGGIIEVCQNSDSLADAGRQLFNRSRLLKSTNNDTHRLKQILKKYAISFDDIRS